MANNKDIELEHNKIYYLNYGANTQIIGRYKNTETTEHNFYSMLHYWNGSESFFHNEVRCHCVTSGIENIRRASKAEIHSLLKFEIENDLC